MDESDDNGQRQSKKKIIRAEVQHQPEKQGGNEYVPEASEVNVIEDYDA